MNKKLWSKVIWYYCLISALGGMLLLIPLIGISVKSGDLKNAVHMGLFAFAYAPFLFAAYHMTKGKRWAYGMMIFFYILEIIAIKNIYDFKLSLFHKGLVFQFKDIVMEFDLIPLAIVVFIALMGRSDFTVKKEL
jgi:hypothetical protein